MVLEIRDNQCSSFSTYHQTPAAKSVSSGEYIDLFPAQVVIRESLDCDFKIAKQKTHMYVTSTPTDQQRLEVAFSEPELVGG